MAPLAESDNRSYLFTGHVHVDTISDPPKMVIKKIVAEDIQDMFNRNNKDPHTISGDELGNVYVNGKETKDTVTLPPTINVTFRKAS